MNELGVVLHVIVALGSLTLQSAGQVSGVCGNGGTCTMVNDTCVCSCVIGFAGSRCEDHLTKVYGSVKYNKTLSDHPVSAITISFTNALKAAYLGYQDSVVTPRNLTGTNSSEIGYVVYITRPSDGFNLTIFRSNAVASLRRQSVTNTIFSSADVAVSSATADIDECVSKMHHCDENANCLEATPGFTCKCNDGFIGDGTRCSEIFCLLSKAPKWPSQAQRMVFLPNKTEIPNSYAGDQMPYRTYIEYVCPDRYNLVNKATNEKQTLVIECVGTAETTHHDSGWSGSEVACVIKMEFTVALIMAVISSVIIVLVGGAFVVACTRKKKNPDDQANALEMNNSYS